MNGNENLPKVCEGEKVGHNAIVSGLQGQRQIMLLFNKCFTFYFNSIKKFEKFYGKILHKAHKLCKCFLVDAIIITI